MNFLKKNLINNKNKKMDSNERKETLIRYAEESEKTVDLFLKIAV